MENMNPTNEPKMADTKKNSIGWVRSLIMIASGLTMIWMTSDVWYLFFRPNIEDVPVLTGRWSVEGELRDDLTSRRRKIVLPSYFVNTPSGRTQVHCGLRSSQQSCGLGEGYNGAIVRVWYHTTLGIMQFEVLPASPIRKGERIGHTEFWESTYANPANSQGDSGLHVLGQLGGLLLLLLGMRQLLRSKKLFSQIKGARVD